MPYKTDGIEFELHPSPKKGEDGQPLLYARPAKGRRLTMKELDDFCRHHRGLPAGELQRVFSLVMEVTGYWLSQGYRVETPLGSFAPRLRLLGEHTDPSRVTGRDIIYDGVEFRPSKELVTVCGDNPHGFRKVKGPVGNRQMFGGQAMREALRKSLRPGYTTIQTFMYYSGLKRDSAKRYLDSLCQGDAPQLRRYQEGQTWHYLPAK